MQHYHSLTNTNHMIHPILNKSEFHFKLAKRYIILFNKQYVQKCVVFSNFFSHCSVSKLHNKPKSQLCSYIVQFFDLTAYSVILFLAGILIGTLTMELGGVVTINCEKTGYKAEIEFKLKVYFSFNKCAFSNMKPASIVFQLTFLPRHNP